MIPYQRLCFEQVYMELCMVIVRWDDIAPRCTSKTNTMVSTSHFKEQRWSLWTQESITFTFCFTLSSQQLNVTQHNTTQFTQHQKSCKQIQGLLITRLAQHNVIKSRVTKRHWRLDIAVKSYKPVKITFVGKPCGGEPTIMSVPRSFSYKLASNCLPFASTYTK